MLLISDVSMSFDFEKLLIAGIVGYVGASFLSHRGWGFKADWDEQERRRDQMNSRPGTETDPNKRLTQPHGGEIVPRPPTKGTRRKNPVTIADTKKELIGDMRARPPVNLDRIGTVEAMKCSGHCGDTCVNGECHDSGCPKRLISCAYPISRTEPHPPYTEPKHSTAIVGSNPAPYLVNPAHGPANKSPIDTIIDDIGSIFNPHPNVGSAPRPVLEDPIPVGFGHGRLTRLTIA